MPSKLYTYYPNTKIESSKMNAEMDAIYSYITSNTSNINLKANKSGDTFTGSIYLYEDAITDKTSLVALSKKKFHEYIDANLPIYMVDSALISPDVDVPLMYVPNQNHFIVSDVNASKSIVSGGRSAEKKDRLKFVVVRNSGTNSAEIMIGSDAHSANQILSFNGDASWESDGIYMNLYLSLVQKLNITSSTTTILDSSALDQFKLNDTRLELTKNQELVFKSSSDEITLGYDFGNRFMYFDDDTGATPAFGRQKIYTTNAQLSDYTTVTNPREGNLAWDYTAHNIKVYDGTSWVNVT